MNSNITFRQYVNRQLKHVPMADRNSYVQSNNKYHPIVVIHDITVVDQQITIDTASMLRPRSSYTINSNAYIKNVYTDGNHQLCGCHHLVSIDGVPNGLMYSTGFTKDRESLIEDALLFAQSRINDRCIIIENGSASLYTIDKQTGHLTDNTILDEQFNIQQLPTYIAMMYNDDSIEQNHKLIEKYHQWCEL